MQAAGRTPSRFGWSMAAHAGRSPLIPHRCVPARGHGASPARPSPRFTYPGELQRGWARCSAPVCLCKRRVPSALQAKRGSCSGNRIASEISFRPLLESAVNAAATCVSPENLTSSEIYSTCALRSQGGCCLWILLQMIYLALLCKRGWLLLGNLTASEIPSFPVPRELRGRRCGVRPDSYGMVSCPLLRKRRVDCCLGNFTACEISFCPVLCKCRVVAARKISL